MVFKVVQDKTEFIWDWSKWSLRFSKSCHSDKRGHPGLASLNVEVVQDQPR